MGTGGDHKRICPICGKTHYPPDLDTYVYKRRDWHKRDAHEEAIFYFCSWSCMRKWDKEQDEKYKKKKTEERAVRWYEQYHTCFECKFYADGTRECLKRVKLHVTPDTDSCPSFRKG